MDNKPDLKAEFDFRDLLRKPHKLFGYSYIFFLVILSVLGISYVQNLTSIGKNTVPPMVVIDSSSFVQDIPFQLARSLPPIDVMTVAGFLMGPERARLPDFRLSTVARHFGLRAEGDAHDAAHDIELTWQLYKRLRGMCKVE